jgi:hypothetical protein
MITRSSVFGFWALAVVAEALCHFSNSAQAGELRCNSHGPMSQSDSRRLYVAIASSFPKGVRLDAEPALCLNNDFARASVSTRTKTMADGSREWWETTCSRKRSRWSCVPGEERFSIETKPPIAGKERLLRITFPGSVSIARAKNLAVESATLHLSNLQAPPPDCQTHENNMPHNWVVLSNALNQLSEFPIDISHDTVGVTSIEVNNNGIVFSVKDDAIDHEGSDKFCWLERITVS